MSQDQGNHTGFKHHDLAPGADSIENAAIRLFDSGKIEDSSDLLVDYLDHFGGDIDPVDRAKLARLLFETSRTDIDSASRRDAAIRWLEAAAEADDAAWAPMLEPAMRAELDELFADPRDRLILLELLSFAPPATELPQGAAALIEEFGHGHAEEPELAREAEILLHALGEPKAAYRVERSRRSAAGRSMPAKSTRTGDAEPSLKGLTVSIAGGHPALRRAILNDLTRAGAKEIRDIPPRWEGSRQGREIAALVSGSDVAVLIGRHIAHSTVDQVKRGADLAGIPMLTSQTASASGVRRVLMDYMRAGRLDRSTRAT